MKVVMKRHASPLTKLQASLYMVSKVVINLLMQPANWAVRNSRVSYAYILVGKLSVLLVLPIQT